MDNEKIRELLDKEICYLLEELPNLQAGGKEHTDAVESVSKLLKVRLDEAKSDIDYDEKYSRRELEKEQNKIEMALKQEEMKENVKNRYSRIALDVAGIIVPTVVYVAIMKQGYKFEENGSLTSQTFREGRGLFSRLFRFIK